VRVFRLAFPLALVLCPFLARAEEPSALGVSWSVDGPLTGAALTVWGASELAKGELVPPACRWCSSDGLDLRARDLFLWSNTRAAATASDLLQLGIPAGVVAYELLAAPDAATAAKDLLVVTEALSVAGVLTQGSRYAFARLRPYAYYGGRDAGRDDHLSFWSAHTVVAFSAAAAGGTVARLRGYQGWPFVYAAGFTGAALTGYFRMGADMHWLTDVLASAAVGTGVGLLVPWLHRTDPRSLGYRLWPVPGGLVLSGEF